MTAGPAIALLGTLDTKGAEIAYTAGSIRRAGGVPVIIDSGILGRPSEGAADITREEVALAGGHDLEEIRRAGSRRDAVELMQDGVRVVCRDLYESGRLNGMLCLGGAEGAQMGAQAMQVLPLGIPKVIVSPSASGPRPFGPFVGRTDTLVMHSVIDILGLNPLSRSVFDNAAAAVVGMAVYAGAPVVDLGPRSVGITMLGQTTPGVMAMLQGLERAGWDPVIFHANGVGGPTMEDFIRRGGLAAVIDYTLSELPNSLLGGMHATGPERLTAAGRTGIPQIVVTGCVEFFNQGNPPPERYRDRPGYRHNSTSTLVRLSRDEMVELGGVVADRLAGARSAIRVIAPTRGFSMADSEGEVLWDPDGDKAFIDALEGALAPGIPFERVDANVNDPGCAALVLERFLALVGTPARA